MSQVVVCQFAKLHRILSDKNLSEKYLWRYVKLLANAIFYTASRYGAKVSFIRSWVPGHFLGWYALSIELHFGLHHLHWGNIWLLSS